MISINNFIDTLHVPDKRTANQVDLFETVDCTLQTIIYGFEVRIEELEMIAH